jgi:hypothetical protein
MLSPSASAMAPTQSLAGLTLEKGKNLCQHDHRPLRPRHLHQHCFGLGQPEGHLHGAIERDGRAQGGTGLLGSSHPAVQGAKAEIAVGLERVLPKLFYQGQGVPIEEVAHSTTHAQPPFPHALASALTPSGL